MPKRLPDGMTRLGTAIAESVVHPTVRQPSCRAWPIHFWFQALGSVMGMDWRSSGITTSVLGALKRGLNPRAHELGLYVCGGRGHHSRNIPDELLHYAERSGLDGNALVQRSQGNTERRILCNFKMTTLLPIAA
jgi:hypothetical protein